MSTLYFGTGNHETMSKTQMQYGFAMMNERVHLRNESFVKQRLRNETVIKLPFLHCKDPKLGQLSLTIH